MNNNKVGSYTWSDWVRLSSPDALNEAISQDQDTVIKELSENLKIEPTSFDLASKVIECFFTQNISQKNLNKFIKTLNVSKTLDVNPNYSKHEILINWCLKAIEKDNKKLALALIKQIEIDPKTDKGEGRIILKALERNHPEIATTLLDKGLDINRKDRDGETILIKAVNDDLEEVVYELINLGADVNVKDREGTPLITLACKKELAAVVEVLLNQGANVDSLDKNRNTPLHYACFFEDPLIAHLLMKEGANVNLKNKTGKSSFDQLLEESDKAKFASVKAAMIEKGAICDKPMLLREALNNKIEPISAALIERMTESDFKELGSTKEELLLKACQKGQELVALALIDKGADINANVYIFVYACRMRMEGVVAALIEKGISLEQHDNALLANAETILPYACQFGLDGVISKLIELDANVNTARNTLLHNAVYRGSEEIVTKLIEQGADVNAVSKLGRTPLHDACYYGYERIIAALIENGANVNVADNDGNTPIRYVWNRGVAGIVKLIEHGANVNVADKNGYTPMHFACNRGDEELVAKLIEHGANVNPVDKHGDTPLHDAAASGSEEIVAMLIEHGANVTAANKHGNTPLHNAAASGFEEIVAMLIEHGANVTAANKHGDTPLHKAASEEIVAKLIEHGANVNAPNKQGDTPLHNAASGGFEGILAKLIEHGANVNAPNKQGATPLHNAASGGSEGILAKLIEKANFIASGIRGRTLHNAASRGSEEIVAMLIEHGADVNLTDKTGCSPFLLAVERKIDIVSFLLHGADITATDRNSKRIIFDRYFSEILPALCECLAEFEPLTSKLKMANNVHEFYQILFRNDIAFHHVADLVKIAREKDANPLKVAFLLRSRELLSDLKSEHLKPNEFLDYFQQLWETYPRNALEDFFLEINTEHYSKGGLLISELPEPLEVTKLKMAMPLYREIKFDKSGEPGSKDPDKLTDEGRPVTEKELRKSLKQLIKRVVNRTPYTGTPSKEEPEALERHYKYVEKLLKLIIELTLHSDADERATNILDLCVAARHCDGKIREYLDMYLILSGRLPKGLEEAICIELQKMRTGIIDDWARREASKKDYEIHYANHYMYLIGEALNLAGWDTFKEPDKFNRITLTKKEALEKFYKEYKPSRVINFIQETLWSFYHDPKSKELMMWFRDFPSAQFNKAEYDELLININKYRKEGKDRKEIFAALKAEYGFNILPPDQTPAEAINAHREAAFVRETKQRAAEWDMEHYGPIYARAKQLKKATREEKEAFLQERGIEYSFNLKESIALHQRNAYLRSISDQWNKKFYDPIIKKVQSMEFNEATEYLKSKGIKLGKNMPLEAIAKHRQKAIVTNTDPDNAASWNEDDYDSLSEHIAQMEIEGASREEIAKYLEEKGIRLEPALEFEDLVQRQKGQDFMNEIFEYKQGKAVGIKRDAVLHLISQFKILKSSV